MKPQHHETRMETMAYTKAEKRALDVVVDEIDRLLCCRLSHLQVAKRAGVGRATVRSAIAKAVSLGALHVQRRQKDGLTNVIWRA